MGVPDWLVRGAFCLVACGEGTSTPNPPSRLEAAIDRGLAERFGVPVVTSCTGLYPPCTTRLPDGTTLPIELTSLQGGWDWRVRGLVITTDQLETYLRDQLADLGVPQAVRCAPRVRLLSPGERIECGLSLGGKAFVLVRSDGTTAVELALDPAAAAARSEPMTPARARVLELASRALAHMADDDEEEEGAAPADAADPR